LSISVLSFLTEKGWQIIIVCGTGGVLFAHVKTASLGFLINKME
jgi:hypothetical protein